MNKRAKNFLLWGGWLALIFVLCKNKTFLVTLVWIFSWSWFVSVVDWLLSLKKRKKTDNESASESDPRFDTPKKAFAMLFNYHISNLLFYLNPLLVMQSFLQIAGMISEKIFGHQIGRAHV